MQHTTGIIFSLCAALFWAIAVILFKKSTETLMPMGLNLLKTTLTLLLLIPTLMIAGVDFFPEKPAYDWIMFAVSGFMGIVIADTLFFMALKRIGAGMAAVVECLYLPFILMFSYLFLNETIGLKGIIGALLVTSAILIGSSNKTSPVEGRQMVTGIILGIFGVSFIAASIVLVKELLLTTDVLWASFVRLLAGTSGLYLSAVFNPSRKSIFSALKPSASWKFSLPATFFGNYLAMICWIAGMKYTLVSVAAILNQLSVIFTFLLAAFFLKEGISFPRIIATLLAVTGAILAGIST